MSTAVIRTEESGLVLRTWCDSDLDSLVRYGNDRQDWRNLTDMFPHAYTRQDAVDWVRIATAAEPSIFLAIDLNGESIGGAGVIARDGHEYHTGQFGYWLGRPYWGKGLATIAARALRQHAFSVPRFMRLEAPVFEWNPASMRVLEKSGFVREGVLRKSMLKDSRLIDQVMYASVRDP